MDGPVTTVDDVLPKDAPAPNTGASKPAFKKASKPAKEGAPAASEAPARSKRDRQQVEFYTDNLKQSEAFTVQQVWLQIRMSPCRRLQSGHLLSECLAAGQGYSAGRYPQWCACISICQAHHQPSGLLLITCTPAVKYRLQEHLTGSDEVLMQLHNLMFRRPGKVRGRHG